MSLAFILAFIGSAVALLIGILIFSEVTEAMALTLPEVLVEIPTTPEVEGLWFAREHCGNTNCSVFSVANEYRFEFESVNGAVKMPKAGAGTDPRATSGYMGKVFDRAELDGKLITLEASRVVLNGVLQRIIFYDGELDPSQSGLHPITCGTDCFPDQAGIVTSGSGGGITVVTATAGFSDFTIKNYTGSANLSAFDSPTGKVTLVVLQPENSQAVGIGSLTYQVTIQDLGTFRFKSDLANSWSGSTITCLVDNDACRVGINGSQPQAREGLWSVTSLPPPPLPVFNSEETLRANEKFDNALNTGFTVVGILPVALFFALFAIFGGRTE